jgi:hypothetical protein
VNARIVIALSLIILSVAHAGAADGNRPPLVDVPFPERWLPLDDDGWSSLKPAADSRLIYVSDSDGDDGTAVVYRPGDPAVGNDPLKPTGAIKPFK